MEGRVVQHGTVGGKQPANLYQENSYYTHAIRSVSPIIGL